MRKGERGKGETFTDEPVPYVLFPVRSLSDRFSYEWLSHSLTPDNVTACVSLKFPFPISISIGFSQNVMTKVKTEYILSQ